MLREKSFAKGELIFREGEEGCEAFRILEGRIEISIQVGGQGDVAIGHLLPGDIFGEMALLDDKPRSATARAIEPTRLHLMNIEEFNDLFLRDPSALAPFLSSFSNVCATPMTSSAVSSNCVTPPPPKFTSFSRLGPTSTIPQSTRFPRSPLPRATHRPEKQVPQTR